MFIISDGEQYSLLVQAFRGEGSEAVGQARCPMLQTNNLRTEDAVVSKDGEVKIIFVHLDR